MTVNGTLVIGCRFCGKLKQCGLINTPWQRSHTRGEPGYRSKVMSLLTIKCDIESNVASRCHRAYRLTIVSRMRSRWLASLSRQDGRRRAETYSHPTRASIVMSLLTVNVMSNFATRCHRAHRLTIVSRMRSRWLTSLLRQDGWRRAETYSHLTRSAVVIVMSLLTMTCVLFIIVSMRYYLGNTNR